MNKKIVKHLDINKIKKDALSDINELFHIEITVSDNINLFRKNFSESTTFYAFRKNSLFISNNFLLLVDELTKYNIDISYNINYVFNYLKYQTPYTSETLVNEINVLRAGENVDIDFDGRKKSTIHKPHRLEIKEDTLYDELKKIPSRLELTDSVFHLSAGLDSSLLALLASGEKKEAISTVSFITLGKGSNAEIETSTKLANEMNSNHQIIDLQDEDIFKYGKEFISNVVGYPIAHPSHILDFIINKKLSYDYKYIISGKGPDDCLAGYNWHKDEYNSMHKHKNRVTVTKEEKLKELFFHDQFQDYYEDYTKSFHIKEHLTLEDKLNYDLGSISSAWDIIHNAENRYLESSILTPLNDEHIRALMYSLPNHLKIDGDKQKIYLRKKFKNLYPEYLLNMPKYGLTLDIGSYLNKSQTDEILNTIFSSKMMKDYLNKNLIIKMIDDTLSGHENMGWQIWSLYLIGYSIKNLEKRKA